MAHDLSDPEARRSPNTPEQKAVGEILADVQKQQGTGWKAPRTAEELHERVCRACEAVGASAQVVYEQVAADPLRLAQWLAFVERNQVRLARLMAHATRNADRPAFKCSRCADCGYAQGDVRAPYSSARFCACELGQAAEAGTWARILFGEAWERFRKPGAAELRGLAAYCKRLGLDRDALLARAKEAEKKRGRAKRGALDN